MNSKQFNRLSLNDRARIILKDATFLVSIPVEDGKADLYSVSYFFIEVQINSDSDVTAIAMILPRDLEKYVEHVELSLLF